MAENCPFCGARIEPLNVGFKIKQCPACRGVWYDSGGGGKNFPVDGDGSGGGALVIITNFLVI